MPRWRGPSGPISRLWFPSFFLHINHRPPFKNRRRAGEKYKIILLDPDFFSGAINPSRAVDLRQEIPIGGSRVLQPEFYPSPFDPSILRPGDLMMHR